MTLRGVMNVSGKIGKLIEMIVVSFSAIK
jgi:hypothetical protein